MSDTEILSACSGERGEGVTSRSGSSRLVSMMMMGLFISHTISQKSIMVCQRGPCALPLSASLPAAYRRAGAINLPQECMGYFAD